MNKDRYGPSQQRAVRIAAAKCAQRELEKTAEQQNARGRYRCAECSRYEPLSTFEYEFKGETKVARRCKPCRQELRKLHGRW